MLPSTNSMDFVRIHSLKIDCFIGIYLQELKKTQPVIADLRLGMQLSQAGRSGKISQTVDYERVANEIATLLKFRRFRLLEAAAEEIAAMLFGIHSKIEFIDLCLKKPQALLNLAKSAAVRIFRKRTDYPARKEATTFGEVEILLETRDAGLYLLHLYEGREIPNHYHNVMRELEWQVIGEMARNGQKMRGFEPVEWKKKQQHRYKNLGNKTATLFCCDVPAFIPEDEILVKESHQNT